MAKGENKRIAETGDPLAIAAMSTGALVATVGGLVGGWIGYSKLGVNHNLPLPEVIPNQRQTFLSPKAGQLSYYADTSAAGRPLVLLHSVNAAGSAYEMRPLFEAYRGKRPVYALDLPGFGFSERSNRVYSWRLFTDAILDFLETQVK